MLNQKNLQCCELICTKIFCRQSVVRWQICCGQIIPESNYYKFESEFIYCHAAFIDGHSSCCVATFYINLLHNFLHFILQFAIWFQLTVSTSSSINKHSQVLKSLTAAKT